MHDPETTTTAPASPSMLRLLWAVATNEQTGPRLRVEPDGGINIGFPDGLGEYVPSDVWSQTIYALRDRGLIELVVDDGAPVQVTAAGHRLLDAIAAGL